MANEQPTPAQVTNWAKTIERHGLEHERLEPLPGDCLAVYRGGNITTYLPILKHDK